MPKTGEKRGEFFEKIKTGRKIRLGGKFISSHLEYTNRQELPEAWVAKINTIIQDLAQQENSNPTPAGEVSTLATVYDEPKEISKWVGRNSIGNKQAIFGVNLNNQYKLFVDTPTAFLVDTIENIAYIHPIALELLPTFEDIVNRTHNKFKGSKISHEPATGKTEDALAQEGCRFIGGMDEAGRGALAGPIVGAVVIVDTLGSCPTVCDSKGVNELIRGKMRQEVIDALPYGIGIVSEAEIDEIGIEKANKLIFRRAYDDLTTRYPGKIDVVVIDGNPIKADQLELPVPYRCITQGEKNSKAIAAASVIAKTERDRIMTDLAKDYPEYAFEEHKGYGTPHHKQLITKFGPCICHRKCFEPIKSILKATNPETGIQMDLGI